MSNLNDAVRLIIERLKTNPEDFFGEVGSSRGLERPRPKFYDITDKIENLLVEPQTGHVHRLWYLNDAEKTALIEAYKEARRARFEAKVFHTLLAQPEPEQTLKYKTTNKYVGGFSDPRAMLVPPNLANQAKAILKAEGTAVQGAPADYSWLDNNTIGKTVYIDENSNN